MNLEQRPQRTQKLFDNFFYARPIKSILQGMFDSKKDEFQKPSSFVDYLFEIINSNEIFESLNVRNLSLNLCSLFFKDIFAQISVLPSKPSLEDFYCSNNFSKNSLIMLNCSQLKRNQSTNFVS